jgi:hypothetical protein
MLAGDLQGVLHGLPPGLVGSQVTRASAAAFSFSHTRGTPRKMVGRTSRTAAARAAASASAVTCALLNIGM